jgi:hypothetical protein
MRRKHTRPLVALAGVCALALVPSGAAAKAHGSTQKFATQISIKLIPDKGKIKGKITSEKKACVKDREVLLNFNGAETPLTPPEFSSRKGRYFIFSTDTLTLPEGTYLTHVKKLKLGNDKVCKPAKSEVLSVRP